MEELNTDEMEYTDLGMSNFDHSIDEGFADVLTKNPSKVYGTYAGYNFNALVWYEHGKFHAEVWRYQAKVDTISCDSLEEIMTEVSNLYGWD